MLYRLRAFFLVLATCGLLAAGCGDDNTIDTKGEGQQECLEQAGKIDNARARKTAEEACNGDADKTRDAAVKQCLDIAKSRPEGDQREKATDACEAAK